MSGLVRTRGRKGKTVLEVVIDPGLRELVEKKAEGMGLDLGTFVEWCLQTGLVLGDLNRFVHERIERL